MWCQNLAVLSIFKCANPGSPLTFREKSPTDRSAVTCQRGGCCPHHQREVRMVVRIKRASAATPAITICPTFPRSLYTYCHVILSIPRVVSLSQQTSVCIIPRFPALPRRCPSPSPIRSTPFPVPCAPVPVPSPIRPPSLRERPIQCHEMHYPLY